jgi:hypothetical protein
MILFAFRRLVNKRKLRENLLKLIDSFFTGIGMIILIICLLVCLPFLILDQWLNGEG